MKRESEDDAVDAEGCPPALWGSRRVGRSGDLRGGDAAFDAINRPVEIPEYRGLDPIGEHTQEQPSRTMGGSNPAQMVTPLEAELIHIEAGKARDRGVERFAL